MYNVVRNLLLSEKERPFYVKIHIMNYVYLLFDITLFYFSLVCGVQSSYDVGFVN